MTTSPSMPTTSVMWVILREPSRRRAAWTITSTEPAIISRMVFDGQRVAAHRDHRFQTADGFARAVGVQRAHRAVVAGVHRLQQVESFRAADLADDDPLGTHTQAVLDEIAHGDLAFAFEVGRPRLETHHVRLLQLKFGRVFAGDDALVVVDEPVRQLSSVVLPEPVPPEIRTLQRTRPMMSRIGLACRRDRAELDQLLEVQPVLLELTNGERRAVDGQRRRDDVDARCRRAGARRRSGSISSTRRPTWLTMRWQIFISCRLSAKRTPVFCTLPATSMKVVLAPLTMMSAMSSRASSGSSGP